MNNLSQRLKSFIRTTIYRLRYPTATIGSGSYLDSDCNLESGVEVGRECHLFQASLLRGTCLKERIIIGRRSRLGNTKIGTGCLIEHDVDIFTSTFANFVSVQPYCELTEAELGRYSYIARNSYLNQVKAGSFVSIGPRALLGTGEHPAHLISTAPVFYSTRQQCGATFAKKNHFMERSSIVLGHDVWLGAQVFVRDGITISDGAIVAAGAVVTKNVPPYAIVGGVPAKIIRFRFSEAIIARLLVLRWWDWPEPRLRAAQPLMGEPDIERFLTWAEQPFPTVR